MKHLQRYLPIFFGVICVLVLGRSLFTNPYPNQEFDFDSFSQIPVLHQGRIKPIDSFARNSLMIINDKQVFRDAENKSQPAIRWLLDVTSAKPIARDHKVFRIEHDGVLSLMGLEPRDGFRYSLNELAPKYQDLLKQVMTISQKPAAARDLAEAKMMQLYTQLENYRQIMSFEAPLMLPPLAGNDDWQPLGSEKTNLQLTTAANAWYKSLKAYQNDDPVFFNTVVQEYLANLKTAHPDLFPRVQMEQRFNVVQPFYLALILFVVAFLLSIFSWMFWAEPLRKSALVVTVFTLALFTVALLSRMYLQGRPPVTNLYSSAIFVGWICVIMGLGIEWYLKNGFGTVMSSITGFSALLVAQNLAGDGDTMEMMRAVLDTNFWLATHVTTVTMGYSASFLAGFMGLVLILMGVLTKKLNRDLYNKISGMIYGTIAFAMLFSFVGTVLGGIWADQSWGRFWGWDPKENGAMMIVIWNAVILHARWGGLAKKRGIALLAIGGNIITAWSWFGVNMLGVGLHSYGFTDGAFLGLGSFVLFNLLVICLGSLPEENWRSYPYFKSGSKKGTPTPSAKQVVESGSSV